MKYFINKNILKNLIINFLLLFILEVIFKIVNFFPIFDWSIIRIILSSFIISFLISNLLYFVPKFLHKFLNIIIIFIFSIYALAQTGFNNFIGVYMSFGTSSQFSAVIDYIKEFILSFNWYYYFLLIPLLLAIVYYIFFENIVNKKFSISLEKNNYKTINKKLFIEKICMCLIALICFCTLYYTTLYITFMQNELQIVSNKKLFENPSVPSISVRQFGVITFGILDLKNYFLPSELIDQFVIDTNKDISSNNTSNERIIDDTKWKEIIEEETNSTLKSLNNYFINNNITNVNDNTGVFEGKNLIVIMMESVNDIFINKDDYPNFYKLYSEGWHWENNYSPRNSCSTGNNEMSGMISLYSIYNTCTANDYKDNTYFESIFNLFNNKGYKTFSAHDYTEHYYYRSTIHSNMGSGHYYGVEELGINYSTLYKNWASDEDFMESVLKIIDDIGNNKFMAWLTTVSSHQPYYSSIEGDKYLSLYKDLEIKTELKRYKSKLKILDNALGILLEGLENKGILDNTVIVLYGDHYPYGLSTSVINSVLDYDTSKDYEAERVPFVIYNSKIKAETFKEYTSYINILPTVANLFNLDYDPRLYVGTDLFSDDYESLVVFADGSWKNEYAYYNAAKSKIEYYSDKKYSVEEIQEINENINNKIKMSSLAIKNNYFNYLYNKMNNISINIENKSNNINSTKTKES